MKDKKRFFILSIDGGGLKGLIAIKILEIIETITGKKITESFNLLGGTSTGGLIVSALTVANEKGNPKYDLPYIENMYLEAGHTLFQNGALTGKEASQLDSLLRKTVATEKLADTILPIAVPTYDLITNKIIVFKTRSAILNESKNIRLIDVCKATSAIPQVFPAHPVRFNNRQLNCVDAGYYIKNPAVSVLAELWKHKNYYAGAELKEEEIVLISISTGNFSGNKKDWSTNIQDILSTQGTATEYIRGQKLAIDLSKINFLRVDLNFGAGGYSLQRLIEIGNKIDVLSKDQAFHKTITDLFYSA